MKKKKKSKFFIFNNHEEGIFPLRFFPSLVKQHAIATRGQACVTRNNSYCSLPRDKRIEGRFMRLAGRDGGWLLEGLVEGMDSRSIMLMYRLRQGRMDEKSKSIRRKKKNFSALKLRRYVDECNEFLEF